MNKTENQAKRLVSPKSIVKLRTMLQVDPIPSGMRGIHQWVCWWGEYRGDNPKLSKVPVDPKTGRNASSTKRETWGTFEQANEHFNKSPHTCGLGFVFSEEDSLVGVDLDNCIDPETGIMQPWAKKILDDLNTYCEISPSGAGVKAFCYGDIPEPGAKLGDLEIYKSKRFFTVTGCRLDGYPDEPQEVGADVLLPLWSRVRPPKTEQTRQAQESGDLSDNDIMQRAREASNGSKFSALFSGDISGHASHSEADAALVGLLTFWTQDEGQIDRIFRRSGLMRDKWDAKNGAGTYGSRTIAAILARGGDRWEPGGNGDGKPSANTQLLKDGKKNCEWEEPKPLIAEERRSPFPVDLLPGGIRDAVNEYVAYSNVPVAIAGCSALAALSLAAQALVDVARDRILVGPCSLSLAVVAESGERKTSCDRVFKAGIEAWQKEKRAELEPERKKAEEAWNGWNAERLGILEAIKAAAKKGDDTDNLKKTLEKCALREPKRMSQLKLFYQDVNGIALADKLSKGYPSAALWTDEGATVTGGNGFKDENLKQLLGILNKLWDGRAFDADRKTVEDVHLDDGKRLTAWLQMQPDIFNSLVGMQGGLARGTGLLARFLIAWPESTIGKRPYAMAPSFNSVGAFNSRIRALLDEPLEYDERGKLKPSMLFLEPEAFLLWRDFYNDVESDIGKERDYHPVKDTGSKTAENAARLAALFHCYENGPKGKISLSSMERGAKLAAYFLEEALSVLEQGRQTLEVTNAQKLLEWLKTNHKGGKISASRIATHGPGALRSRKVREEALLILEETCHVRIEKQSHNRKDVVLHPGYLK